MGPTRCRSFFLWKLISLMQNFHTDGLFNQMSSSNMCWMQSAVVFKSDFLCWKMMKHAWLVWVHQRIQSRNCWGDPNREISWGNASLLLIYVNPGSTWHFSEQCQSWNSKKSVGYHIYSTFQEGKQKNFITALGYWGHQDQYSGLGWRPSRQIITYILPTIW